jgi:hypothetical protein
MIIMTSHDIESAPGLSHLHQLLKGQKKKNRLTPRQVPALLPSWQRFRGINTKNQKQKQ